MVGRFRKVIIMSDHLKNNITRDEIKSLRYTLKELDIYLKELDRDRSNNYVNDVNEKRLLNKFELIENLFANLR